MIIGCGYLGARVAETWQAAGDRVSALTRSPTTAQRFAEQGWQPILGDVTDRATLAALPAADVVLYAVGLDRTSGQTQREVYVTGLQNVLEQLAGRVGRFISISSSSVYGQSAGEWIDETSPCVPDKPNGQVCLEAEQLVWRFFPRGTTGTNASPVQGANESASAQVLRLSGIYGPGRLLSRVADLRAGQPLTGNPDVWLNLIHVDDAVRAVIACEQRGQPGETYLVSDDQPLPRRDYYAALARLAGAPPPVFAASSGSDATRLNKRCRNTKLRQSLQVELLYPTIASGLPQALGEQQMQQ